jgi:hypothetical protein
MAARNAMAVRNFFMSLLLRLGLESFQHSVFFRRAVELTTQER